MADSFEDRIRRDHEYWRQAKYVRGEQEDVHATDGLATLILVGLAALSFPVLLIFKALGDEEPGLPAGLVTAGLFLLLFGRLIVRVLSNIGK